LSKENYYNEGAADRVIFICLLAGSDAARIRREAALAQSDLMKGRIFWNYGNDVCPEGKTVEAIQERYTYKVDKLKTVLSAMKTSESLQKGKLIEMTQRIGAFGSCISGAEGKKEIHEMIYDTEDGIRSLQADVLKGTFGHLLKHGYVKWPDMGPCQVRMENFNMKAETHNPEDAVQEALDSLFGKGCDVDEYMKNAALSKTSRLVLEGVVTNVKELAEAAAKTSPLKVAEEALAAAARPVEIKGTGQSLVEQDDIEADGDINLDNLASLLQLDELSESDQGDTLIFIIATGMIVWFILAGVLLLWLLLN